MLSFLMVPCSNLVACMVDIFPLIFFLIGPDSALHKGRAMFSFSWLQGTILCSALVVGRAEFAFYALVPYVALLEGSVPLWRAMLALLLYAPRLFLLGPRFLKPRFLFSSFLHLQ